MILIVITIPIRHPTFVTWRLLNSDTVRERYGIDPTEIQFFHEITFKIPDYGTVFIRRYKGSHVFDGDTVDGWILDYTYYEEDESAPC